jgi:hypothetical protein
MVRYSWLHALEVIQEVTAPRLILSEVIGEIFELWMLRGALQKQAFQLSRVR